MVEQRTEKATTTELINRFIASRRNGLSPLTIHKTYRLYLRRASEVVGLEVSGQAIQQFLSTRQCSSGGKHAYYRTLKCFYNWLYSRKSDFGLNPQDNPILIVDPPKVERKILPNLTQDQIDYLIGQANSLTTG